MEKHRTFSVEKNGEFPTETYGALSRKKMTMMRPFYISPFFFSDEKQTKIPNPNSASHVVQGRTLKACG